MKIWYNLMMIGAICFGLSACNNAPERPDPILDPSYVPPIEPSAPSVTTPEPAQNASGVWHYTCSNGCDGGAGSAIACSKCGTTLVHNSAYHNAATTPTTTPSSITTTQIPAGTQGVNVTPQNIPKPTEPAQNASGVWHYTCSNGCDGGAGSAIACSKCGNTLAHNSAYHN